MGQEEAREGLRRAHLTRDTAGMKKEATGPIAFIDQLCGAHTPRVLHLPLSPYPWISNHLTHPAHSPNCGARARVLSLAPLP